LQLTHHTTAGLVALALGLLATSGCGDDDESSARPDRPGAGRSDRLEPRPWQRAVPAPDGRTLRIYYLTGPAFALERVRVDQSPQAVTVTLLERPPGPGPQSAVGEIRCQQVKLARPLADRQIMDGAIGHRPQSSDDTLPRRPNTICRPPMTG